MVYGVIVLEWLTLIVKKQNIHCPPDVIANISPLVSLIDMAQAKHETKGLLVEGSCFIWSPMAVH